jgi:hypothetical protein
VIGIAAVLGSVALLGSNRRTLDEITAAIRTQEARRSEMIDGLELQDTGLCSAPSPRSLTVPDPPT